MARLIRHVSLFDGDGNLCTFGPGSDVPDWAALKITNPEVWDATPEIVVPEAILAVTEPSVAVEPLPEPAPVVEPVKVSVGDPPPQNGPGAGRQLWADYAEANGVAVQSDWKREAIIEACEKAGVAV